MMGQHRAGSKTQGIWAYGRYDDQPMALDEMENLLLQEIRKYFMIRWSRHYKKFDEHNLMNRVQFRIVRNIREGSLPGDKNLIYYVPAHLMCSTKPIPTMYLETHLQAVGTYLQEKMVQPGKFRAAEHARRIKDQIEARERARGTA